MTFITKNLPVSDKAQKRPLFRAFMDISGLGAHNMTFVHLPNHRQTAHMHIDAHYYKKCMKKPLIAIVYSSTYNML